MKRWFVCMFVCGMLLRGFKPCPMTVDHKPAREDETRRIRDAGGFVINNRVMGELAVSRAFGDCEFKKGIQVIFIFLKCWKLGSVVWDSFWTFVSFV